MRAFYLALDGEGEAPAEWLVSQVAESFGISPLTARAELEEDPRFIFRIMDLRALAAAKRAVDAMGEGTKLDESDPHVVLALEFLAEQLRARQGG